VSERVTNAWLDSMERIAGNTFQLVQVIPEAMLSLISEVRAHRAAELTNDDREWLRKLRDGNMKHAPSEVRAVVDKLLSVRAREG